MNVFSHLGDAILKVCFDLLNFTVMIIGPELLKLVILIVYPSVSDQVYTYYHEVVTGITHCM